MEEKLKLLADYLQSKGYEKKTIKGYVSNVKKFMNWLEKHGTSVEKLEYAEGLKWVGYRQGQGVSSRTINHEILSINHLYKSLELPSPLEELRLRGLRHESKAVVIEYESLENLYEVYEESGATGKRNKAILGMLIYQGLKRLELEQLRLEDLDMENGLLRVRGTRTSASRILKLCGEQILDLNRYVYEVRKELAKGEHDYLYVSKVKGGQMNNMLGVIWKSVKRNYGLKLTASEVRSSVIRHWLKDKDVREVQYMAGHKYASSTFKYGARSLEELMEEIELIHPLNN